MKTEMYQKVPVVIEAVQLTLDNLRDVALWCEGKVAYERKASDPENLYVVLKIPTLEGVMTGNVGDWIIKGVEGEFYPCKDSVFRVTYGRLN